jgi:hypothetical protein
MQRLITLNYLIWILSRIDHCASLAFTNQNYDGIQVGVPFNLTWEGAQGAVVLGLLFITNASSPQNTTIIACKYTQSNFRVYVSVNIDSAGITESQYTWVPPHGTAGLFAQKIEAQDDAKNLALTTNFTVAEAVSAVTSIQQVSHLRRAT